MIIIRKYVFWFAILAICVSSCSYANQDLLNRESLRTGFYLKSFPDVSLVDLDVALRYWSGELSKQDGIASTITLYQSLDKMKIDFYKGKINFIVASPLTILNTFDLELLAEGYKLVFAGHKKDKLLVVTHTESGIDSFRNIKNKQLSLLVNDPISKMYANVLALNNFKKKVKQVVKEINYVKKSNRLIYKLFFKNTDVIFVYKYAYDLAIELNPQIKLQTQVIQVLHDVPPAIGFFHRRENPEFRRTVIDAVQNLKEHPKGQQILSLFFAEKAVSSHVDDLKTVQKLKQTYLQLIKQGKDSK